MNQQSPYPGQQPQQPLEPQQQPVAPQQPGISGMAVAALVLGVVGVTTSFVPIVNNAAFFLGIIGLVLAIVGLVGINKGKKRGRGIAVAGLVLGIVTIVVVLATQSLYSTALDEAQKSLSSSSSSSATASSSQASSASQAATATPAASDYEVTIDGVTMGTDYQGAPAAIVTYTWTNNSDKATSFAVALMAKCFQNGVQCETAIVTDLDSNYMTEIKPGASTTVQLGYVVPDTSDITVEVTKLISFSNDVLAEKTFSLA